jgi:uncharacterized protein (DUF1778 family)
MKRAEKVRLVLRMSRKQKEALEKAAAMAGVRTSTFALMFLVSRAREILSSRRFGGFLRLVDPETKQL